MKKHFRKLFVAFFIAVCAVCFAVGFAACTEKNGGGGNNNGGETNQPTPLAAPELELSGNELSWNEVAHAEGYEVYTVNGNINNKITDTTETTYTITEQTPCDIVYKVKAVTSDEKYTGTFSNEQRYLVTEQLETPENFSLDGTEITWDSVDNASGYWVYENDSTTPVQKSTKTSYTITKKAKAGNYVYKVTAVSANYLYTESEPTETETFTVEALDVPQISVNEATAILTWTEVDNAQKYELYFNDSLIKTTETGGEHSYVISQDPGEVGYTVKALCESVYYADSEADYIYDAPLIAEIKVNVPEGFNYANVKVVLSNGTTDKEVEITDYTSAVRVIVPVDTYTVELDGLPANYFSTQTTVLRVNRFGTITVIEVTEGNSIKLGTTPIEVTFPGDPQLDAGSERTVTVTKELIFKSEADGVYTVTAMDVSTTKKVTISANNVKIVDAPISLIGSEDGSETANFNFSSGNFTLGSGKYIILTFVFETYQDVQKIEATYNVKIEKEEQEQKKYLYILSQPYRNEFELPETPEDPEHPEPPKPGEVGCEQDLEQQAKTNQIIDSCTRYIKSDKDQALTIFFSYATLGQYTNVTVKINGKEYSVLFGSMIDTSAPQLYCSGCDSKVEDTFKYYCADCETEVGKDATECPNPDCHSTSANFLKIGICGQCKGFATYKTCTTCGAHLDANAEYCETCHMYANIAYIDFKANEEVKVEIIFSGSSIGRHPVVSFWVHPKRTA